MIAFTCILLMFCVVPGAAEFTDERCNTTDDRLHIVVESASDADIYVKRVKHFVQYFLSKRENSSQMPITVIEPYNQKVLIISTVNSSQEILDGLDRINSIININTSNAMNLSKALSYIQEVVHNGNLTAVEESPILIAWFTLCNTNCKQMFQLCLNYKIYFGERQLILFIISRSNRINLENTFGGDFVSIVVDYFDDFSEGNKIDTQVCKECPIGWVTHHHVYDPKFFSCYKIFTSSTKVNWLNAHKQCTKLSASLPVLENEEELRVFKSLNLNYYTQPYHLVIVDLTLKGIEPDVFQWTNGRPYTLSNAIERKHGDGKCVVLRLEGKNESIGEERVIKWELVDCTENLTEIVVCERAQDNFLIHSHNLSSRVRVAKTKMKSLNKEFIFDESSEEMCSIANMVVDIMPEMILEMRLLIFDCGDGSNFVVYSKLCNCVKDCYNGRDEDHCDYFSDLCQQIIFFCINPNANEFFPTTTSIPIAKRCNALQDCPDDSDEVGCDECTERRCSDGTCVPRHWLSRDGEHCQLYFSDEGSLFVQTHSENNDTLKDSLHEVVYCNQLEPQNHIDQFSNLTGNIWAPKCIFLKGLSGSPIGCHDMSHLQGCDNFKCPDEFIKCFHSYCIPTYLLFDDQSDCPYGEDERFPYDSSGLFVCTSGNMKNIYIHPAQVCDGLAQCPDKQDELNCHVICPRGFKCFGSAVVVDDYSQVLELKSLKVFDINTKFLNLTGLDLSNLNEVYILPNLLSLDVSNCKLQTLDYIFSQEIIIPLFNLDLSNNFLTDIKQRSYKTSSLANLVYLNLSRNIHLSCLPKDWLDTERIKTLDLSWTNISILDLNCITKRKSLRNLYLANTKMKRMLDILDIRNTCLSDSQLVMVLGRLTITSALLVDNFKYCCPQIVGNGIPKSVCYAPYDEISSCKDLIGDTFQRSLLWVVSVLSLFGNIMVLICRIFYKSWAQQNHYKYVEFNLGIADFIMGVYLSVIASADFYFRDIYVKYEKEWRSSMLCKFSGFLSTLSNETFIFFIFLINLEMILWARFPSGEYRPSTLVRRISVASSWVLGFILAIIPIVYPQWKIFSSNGMCLGLPLTSERREGWHFGIGVFIIFNSILFLFLVFGQFLTFLFVSSYQMAVKTRRETETCVAKQLSVVVLSKCLCWFPICLNGLMSINGHNVNPETYAWFVIFVLPLNSALNPLIYVIPALYTKWIEFKTGTHSSSQTDKDDNTSISN